MAFLIPSNIQKRLLHYALTHFPVIDTDTLDLEQLDIAWGKRSTVELRDVGLHVKKLSQMLHLPDDLEPTKARIVSLRIAVPANIYSGGIEVEVQGIDIQLRLGRPAGSRKGSAVDNLKASKAQRSHADKAKSKRVHVESDSEDDDDLEDHIPTAQELAESFLDHEPVGKRHELETALHNAAAQQGDDSDAISETSDEEYAGTGVGLSVPAFLANFLKGIVDRMQVSISNVKFILDAELPPDDDLPMINPSVSLKFGITTVSIEGFTSSPDKNLQEDEGEPDERDGQRRRIRLQGIYGEIVTEKAMFASLERVPSMSSRQLARSTSSTSQLSQKTGSFSPRAPQSPSASHSSRQRHDAALKSPQHGAPETSASLRWSDLSQSRMRGSRDSFAPESDRFADPSDDGNDPLGYSFHQGSDLHVSSLASSRFTPSEIEDVEEEPLFSMDDACSSPAYDRGNIDTSSGLDASVDYVSSTQSRFSRRLRDHFAATAPAFGPGRSDDRDIDRQPPSHSSQPVPRSLNPKRQRALPTSSVSYDVGPDEAYKSPPKSDSSGSPSNGGDTSSRQDLSQSMMFNHEDAESMYMSAFSEASSDHFRVPGLYPESSDGSDDSLPPRNALPPEDDSMLDPLHQGGGTHTPRPGSPLLHDSQSGRKPTETRPAPPSNDPSTSRARFSSPLPPTSSKRVLSIDEISLLIPWSTPATEARRSTSAEPNIPSSSERKHAGQMPGAFSQYQSTVFESSKPRRSGSVHTRFNTAPLPEDSIITLQSEPLMTVDNAFPDVGIDIGDVQCDLDTSATRLLYRLALQMVEIWSNRPQEPVGTDLGATTDENTSTFGVELHRFTLAFLENLPSIDSRPPTASTSGSSSTLNTPLFKMDIKGANVHNQIVAGASQVKLELQTFRFGYSDEAIISFEKTPRRRSTAHRADLKQEMDIELTYKSTQARGSEIEAATLPIKIVLNLQKLDARLSSFGGVSGILDLGSSVASNSTILAPSPILRANTGKVRFGTLPAVPDSPTLSPVKINTRIRGVQILLEGKACAVKLESGKLRIVVRKDVARVTADNIQFRGPFRDGTSSSDGITINISNINLPFLVNGAEEDLEALVNLIEPSGDRYEDDDGLLMDMLRRQRKNGSVLRVAISEVLVQVDHLEHADKLRLLSEELGRLSSGVTKYLPEDERPGILILPTIASFSVHATVNNTLGLVEITCENITAAFVGVPLLLGFRIDSVHVTRDTVVVISPLLHVPANSPSPMAMGRIIGNEPKARLKIKFFNLLVEYKIPTILAILGLSEADTVEDLAMSMAASVATLRGGASPDASEIAPSVPDSQSVEPKKPTHVDIFVRDCAMGLNPANSNSKALFLLADSQLTVDETIDEGFHIDLLMRRAHVLLVDDVEGLDLDIPIGPRVHNPDRQSPAVDDLSRQGFQAVASIWVATTVVNITKTKTGETVVDVNLTNNLFTLETCADSTQTLMAVLGGLAPPLPKRKQQMYRMNVTPIENMMASFTGEAFAQSEANTKHEDESLDMEEADYLLEDLPNNLDFVGSFYDPEDTTGDYEPSVLGSVNRISSRLLAPARNETLSFTDSIEEKFEHKAENSFIDTDEDYIEIFKHKAPVRKWNSKLARFEPIYKNQVKECSLKVTAKLKQITFNLYDGYDWANTRDKIAQKVEELEDKAEQRRRQRHVNAMDDDDGESEVGDMLFQSIWIAIPPNAGENDLRKGINREMAGPDQLSETASTRTSVDTRATHRPVNRRRKSRSLNLERSIRKMSFELKGVVLDMLVLPENAGEETQSSVALRLGEFDIFDHMPSSTWRKFATYMKDAGERQMGKPQIRLDAVTVRHVADLAATEMYINVNVLPLRLHVDQDALDFITRFFEFKNENAKPSSGPPGPYIARLEVNTIPIQLDYKPKKIDYAGLRSGHTSEFANFVILERSNLKLKRLIIHGIQSPDLLQAHLKGLWTDDVIKNQLHTVLTGLSAIRPLVDVGSGVRNLIMVPLQEYRKDGRIVRSIQKGAFAFAKTTTSELARLGAKVAIGTQTMFEGVEGFLAPAADRRTRRRRSRDDWDDDDVSTSPAREDIRVVSNYADQPLSVVSGVQRAWRGLERDITTVQDAIIAIGGDFRESTSAAGAASAVGRYAPTVILRPAIGVSKAIGTALLGAGNQLDKDSRRKVEDKYKRY